MAEGSPKNSPVFGLSGQFHKLNWKLVRHEDLFVTTSIITNMVLLCLRRAIGEPILLWLGFSIFIRVMKFIVGEKFAIFLSIFCHWPRIQNL